MSKRIRHHVNPLSEQYLAFTPTPVALTADTIEVELGCAEGDFLFRRSRMCPDSLIIGLEIRRDLVAKINEEARMEKCEERVLGIFANLNIHIPVLFKEASVDRFFINFPDPWFKKQHHKRRVVSPEILKHIITALKPGGELLFQSDIFDLALDAMSVIEEHGDPHLQNVRGAWSFYPKNPYGAPTRRELFVSEEGGSIWRILYTRS